LSRAHQKKLIEVALPLEAINKAAAREKSIRHGHPSTLHLWWARRPLAQYVPMRRGTKAKSEFENACRDLQLEDSLVGDAIRTHKERYTINYAGRPRLLDRHLKRGRAHNDALSFRLYYFWDDETETVVVGWLPSHLARWPRKL